MEENQKAEKKEKRTKIKQKKKIDINEKWRCTPISIIGDQKSFVNIVR
jgi:hypothetical protein